MELETFQLHDFVIVREQPKMQYARIEGLHAVITEIEGDHCTIAELQLSGRAWGGSGAVPLSCLEKPKRLSGPWRAAYAVYKHSVLQSDEWTAQDEEKQKQRKRAIRLVADKFSLEPKTIRVIMKDLEAAGVIRINNE